jgi:hypothetical protein
MCMNTATEAEAEDSMTDNVDEAAEASSVMTDSMAPTRDGAGSGTLERRSLRLERPYPGLAVEAVRAGDTKSANEVEEATATADTHGEAPTREASRPVTDQACRRYDGTEHPHHSPLRSELELASSPAACPMIVLECWCVSSRR